MNPVFIPSLPLRPRSAPPPRPSRTTCPRPLSRSISVSASASSSSSSSSSSASSSASSNLLATLAAILATALPAHPHRPHPSAPPPTHSHSRLATHHRHAHMRRTLAIVPVPVPVPQSRPQTQPLTQSPPQSQPQSPLHHLLPTTLPRLPDSIPSLLHSRLTFLRRTAHTLNRTLRLVVDQATPSSSAKTSSDAHNDHDHQAAVNDALVLLLTTVIIIPLARRLSISPILGFLAAGIFLGPNAFALIRDVRTSKALAELGVVFFLFEMGLELSTSKLKSLGADVFGLGTAQFLVTGLLLSLFPIIFFAVPSQTAIVLGAGLALSSSAFVLQLLAERGEVGTRFGRAAFGILLFQDLAVVPVLVLTPLLAGSGSAITVLRAISIASAKAAAALTFIFIIGKNFLQPVFRFVARAKSSEAFIAAILLTVLATSSLTQMLGLSDTLGAFLAGVMLAETKFRHQVEADIKPFRGLLLGLFFITVGFSIDLNLAFSRLGTVASIVTGLMAVKASVIAVAAVAFGLSTGSALRTGLLLSQGGEFAFVIFQLAMSVGVMPVDMGQMMLLVVALSMALTPLMAGFGRRISSSLEKRRGLIGVRMEDADTADARDFVMVAGWGRVGQSVCEMLDAKLVRYMAFDMSPTRVIDARNKGLPVFFGDARRPEVLRSAGAARARAVVVTLDDPEQALDAVQNIRREFEGVQVFCRARDSKHQKLLQAAGATAIVPELLEASLLLGGAVLLDYGTPIEEVNALIEEARAANVEEMGISDSVAATLGSSFKQLVLLKEEEMAKEEMAKEEAAAKAAAKAAKAAVRAAAAAKAKAEASDGTGADATGTEGVGDGVMDTTMVTDSLGASETEVDAVGTWAATGATGGAEGGTDGTETTAADAQREGTSADDGSSGREGFRSGEDPLTDGKDLHVDTRRGDRNV